MTDTAATDTSSANVTTQAEETPIDLVSPRDCTRCKGVGTTFSKGFTYGDKTYPDKTETCSRCKGEKQYPAPKWDKILEQITTGRGLKDGKRKMLASFPSKLNHYSDREAARAYYVWRNARFHGGKDMTMPMTADMVIGGDPFQKELLKLSEIVAIKFFGTDMAAAHRWARAFGII